MEERGDEAKDLFLTTANRIHQGIELKPFFQGGDS
jgi:hypothetical protein